MSTHLNKDQIMNIVSDMIQDTFSVGEEDVTRDTVAIDIPGWDSLSYIILLSSIEDELGQPLELENAKFENVGELVDFIDASLNG